MKKLLLILLLSYITSFAQIEQFDFDKYFTDNGNIMLFIDPQDGRILKANNAAAKFYHWSVTELESMNIKGINTFTKQQVQKEMQSAKSEKRNYFIFNHRLANNSIKKVRVFSTPVQYKNKTILFSTIIPDLSKQELYQHFVSELEEQVLLQIEDIKQEEKKNLYIVSTALLIVSLLLAYLLFILKQRKTISEKLVNKNKEVINSHKFLQSIIDENPNPIIIKNYEGKFILVNQALANLYNTDKETMIGKDDGDFIIILKWLKNSTIVLKRLWMQVKQKLYMKTL